MTSVECHGLDTPEMVCFYEQDFYVLSNFSSFQIEIWGHLFPTSEHAYHWAKFEPKGFMGSVHQSVRNAIKSAPSAHQAFKIAGEMKALRRFDWDDVKVAKMRQILTAKIDQHEYVYRKLMATGDRLLVENSWRDDVWGWGPNKDGQNLLGKLWMELREQYRGMASVGRAPHG